jgi:hypothetical protein
MSSPFGYGFHNHIDSFISSLRKNRQYNGNLRIEGSLFDFRENGTGAADSGNGIGFNPALCNRTGFQAAYKEFIRPVGFNQYVRNREK